MKTITTIFACLLFSLTLLSQPKVITVDNRPNTGPDVVNVHYSSLSDAVSAAIQGDTIQIHPSSSGYGGTGNIRKHSI